MWLTGETALIVGENYYRWVANSHMSSFSFLELSALHRELGAAPCRYSSFGMVAAGGKAVVVSEETGCQELHF